MTDDARVVGIPNEWRTVMLDLVCQIERRAESDGEGDFDTSRAMALLRAASESNVLRPKCEGCGQEIDPNVCGCGEAIDGKTHDGHNAVPMGCNCYRADASPTEAQFNFCLGLLDSARQEMTPVPGETAALCRAIDDFLHTGVVPDNCEGLATETHRRGRCEVTAEELAADIPPVVPRPNNLQRAMLVKRLREAQGMIGRMCSEGRPPKMSIPARPDHDEDLMICDVIRAAIEVIENADNAPKMHIPTLFRIPEEAWEPEPPTKAGRDAALLDGLERLLAHDDDLVIVSNDESVWLERGHKGNQKIGEGRNVREAIAATMDNAPKVLMEEAPYDAQGRGVPPEGRIP